MRLVIQRVSSSSVTVDGRSVGEIGRGVMVLVGISADDSTSEVDWAAEKICGLRIFEDDQGKMNRSLLDVGGEALIVSQFTLYGDARKGRRPSFIRAASGPEAKTTYEEVIEAVRDRGVPCRAGVFGAMMDVALVNDGPVTILLDSDKTF